jgi:hypothetical protein
VTDAEQIDALAFQLMRALDKNEALEAEKEELRVENIMLRRQLRYADDAMQSWSERDGMPW